ncbi:hypothetical protein Hamer_G018884, partial [Homarus americanus]
MANMASGMYQQMVVPAPYHFHQPQPQPMPAVSQEPEPKKEPKKRKKPSEKVNGEKKKPRIIGQTAYMAGVRQEAGVADGGECSRCNKKKCFKHADANKLYGLNMYYITWYGVNMNYTTCNSVNIHCITWYGVNMNYTTCNSVNIHCITWYSVNMNYTTCNSFNIHYITWYGVNMNYTKSHGMMQQNTKIYCTHHETKEQLPCVKAPAQLHEEVPPHGTMPRLMHGKEV